MKTANTHLLNAPSEFDGRTIAHEIVACVAVLALLYWGREVLIPITLAIIISLMILPFIRGLRRVGLGMVSAVMVAVSALSAFIIAIAIVLGFQVAHVAASLPQYEETIHAKIAVLREVTLDRMSIMQGEAGRVFSQLSEQSPRDIVAPGSRQLANTSAAPVRVEIQEPPKSPQKIIAKIFSSVWEPLQTSGIVLVVLIFVLLDYEALRDRLIGLVGAGDLRSTTAAINDAGERLSRYFASQFAVNFGVGFMIGLGLFAIGFPHAVLWGILTMLLRFVPYLGIVLATASAALLAAAVAPGWSMAVMTLVMYLAIEIVTTQFIEPKLYGHSTGVSPLSVVIGAIFWSWLWGPVGLIVSTPLTLCLAVAGHHVKGLRFLDILLGDAPALTMAQRFYQRALSGDAEETIAAARIFLKRKSFASYCDSVLMRALHLAALDFMAGEINDELQKKVSIALVSVLEGLGEVSRRRSRAANPGVLTHTNLAYHLRNQREQATGRWQGPVLAPPGSVVLGISPDSIGNGIATEILVRILRDHHIDAKHLTMEEMGSAQQQYANAASVAMVCVVSLAPDPEHELDGKLIAQIRSWFPDARIAAVLLPGVVSDKEHLAVGDNVDLVLGSFEEVVQHTSKLIPSDRSSEPQPYLNRVNNGSPNLI
jgi:predicted PurR-regulated permease PerM